MKFVSFMDQALEQAEIAFKKDEVPVGAIIVDKNKQIIAQSYNQNISLKDPTAHAEILVIRTACLLKNSHRLDGCDLYVTLEPCAMCAAAISLARIERLYYAVPDSKFGAVENGTKFFSNRSCYHKPQIYSQIGYDKSIKLLKKFFSKKR